MRIERFVSSGVNSPVQCGAVFYRVFSGSGLWVADYANFFDAAEKIRLSAEGHRHICGVCAPVAKPNPAAHNHLDGDRNWCGKIRECCYEAAKEAAGWS